MEIATTALSAAALVICVSFLALPVTALVLKWRRNLRARRLRRQRRAGR